jgi:hypothetical protein
VFIQSLYYFIIPIGYNFLGIAQENDDEYMDCKSRSAHHYRTSSVDDIVTVDDDNDNSANNADESKGKPIHFRWPMFKVFIHLHRYTLSSPSHSFLSLSITTTALLQYLPDSDCFR